MIQSNTPIILYDINNKVLTNNIISESNSFFIRSYQLFSIEIIETELSTNKIVSVKPNPVQNPNELFLFTEGKSLVNENFSYTLFIESNTIIRVTGIDNISVDYFITYKPDNIIDETNQHYNDLLVNNNLPSYNQLEETIISNNKREVLKRLLLDFKNIINKKGTKTGIVKFMNLIGFTPESITVYDEYLNLKTNEKTLSPDKTKDIKTGFYHLLYDNWIIDNEKYTIKIYQKEY